MTEGAGLCELGAGARALIFEAEGAGLPSPAVKERVRSMLAVQLGATVTGAAAPATLGASSLAATAGATGARMKLSVATAQAGASYFRTVGAHLAIKGLVGMALAVAVTSAVLGARHATGTKAVDEPAPTSPHASAVGDGTNESTAPPSSSGVHAVNHELVSPAVPTDVAARPRAAAAAKAASPAKTPPVVTDDAAPRARASVVLAREGEGEAVLFTKVDAALEAGDGAAALVLLDRHEHLYPLGVLAHQRPPRRVVAQCAVGRTPAARSAAERFLLDHPRSSEGGRVRRVCAVP